MLVSVCFSGLVLESCILFAFLLLYFIEFEQKRSEITQKYVCFILNLIYYFIFVVFICQFDISFVLNRKLTFVILVVPSVLNFCFVFWFVQHGFTGFLSLG